MFNSSNINNSLLMGSNMRQEITDTKNNRTFLSPKITSTPITSPVRRNTTPVITPVRNFLGPKRYSLSDNTLTSTYSTYKDAKHSSKHPPGPLLASTRYNVNVSTYVDSKSPGYATRVVQYDNESSHPTHQQKYGSPGLFPIVHLFKKDLPVIRPKAKKVTIQIGSPDCNRPYSQEHNRLLLEGIVQNSVPTNANFQSNESGTRSVLDALKEISRKRIHTNDGYDSIEEVNKKFRKDCMSSESDSNKRTRVDSPVLESSISPIKQVPKRFCMIDAVTASRTSSCAYNELQEKGTKRKTIDRTKSQISPENKKKLIHVETQTLETKETKEPELASAPETESQIKESKTEDIETKKLPRRQILKVFDDKPLEIIRKNRLGALLSALTGQEISPIPLEDRRKDLDRDINESTAATTKKLVSILSPQNKLPKSTEKRVTFSMPESTSPLVPNDELADLSETQISSSLITPSVSASTMFSNSHSTPAQASETEVNFDSSSKVLKNKNETSSPIGDKLLNQPINVENRNMFTKSVEIEEKDKYLSNNSFTFEVEPASLSKSETLSSSPPKVDTSAISNPVTSIAGGFKFDLNKPVSLTTPTSILTSPIVSHSITKTSSSLGGSLNSQKFSTKSNVQPASTSNIHKISSVTESTSNIGRPISSMFGPSHTIVSSTETKVVTNPTADSTFMFGATNVDNKAIPPITNNATLFPSLPSSTHQQSTFSFLTQLTPAISSNSVTTAPSTFAFPTTSTVIPLHTTTTFSSNAGKSGVSTCKADAIKPTFCISTTAGSVTPFGISTGATSASTFSTNCLTSNPTFGITKNMTVTPSFGTNTSLTSTPTFGMTTNDTAAPTFGITTNVTNSPTFGATNVTATPTFGVSSNVAPTPTFGIGATSTFTPGFGAVPATTSALKFGTTTSTTSAPTFNSTSSTNSIFGSPAPNSSMFATTTTTGVPSFSSNASTFGTSNPTNLSFGTSKSELSSGAASNSPAPHFVPNTTSTFGVNAVNVTNPNPSFLTAVSIPAFGNTASSTTAFGNTTAASPFGNNPSSVAAFGTTPASVPGFGATSNPTFEMNKSAPAFAKTTIPTTGFGTSAPSSGFSFGANNSPAPTFPAMPTSISNFPATTTTATAFGSNSKTGGSYFGATNGSFGANTTNSFNTSTPIFSLKTTQSAQPFGSTSVNTTSSKPFGAPFGANNSGFGNFGGATTPFGQTATTTATTGFGSTNTPSFGISSNSTFGSNNALAATSAPTFGSVAPSNAFEQNNGNNTFSSGFGNSTTKPPISNMFSSQPQQPNIFGNSAESAFGGNNQGNAGFAASNQPQAGVFTFGSASAPSAGVFSFGSNETPKQPFGFSNAPNATAGFGSPPSAFGTTQGNNFTNTSAVPPFNSQPSNVPGMFSIGTGSSTSTHSRGRAHLKAKRRT